MTYQFNDQFVKNGVIQVAKYEYDSNGNVVGLNGLSATLDSSTIVLFGDSIICNNNVNNGLSYPNNTMSQHKLQDIGWFNWANIGLKGYFNVLRNSAISGQTSSNLLTRIDSDVIAYKPHYCLLSVGINDVTTGVDKLTTVANIKEICNRLASNGIRIILCTMLPNNTVSAGTTTQKESFSYINSWIRSFGNNYNVIVIDIFASVYDANTPCAATSGTFTDSTHPGTIGASVIGNYVATVSPLSKIAKLRNVLASTADAASATYLNGNLVTNPCMNGTGGATSGSTVFTGTPPASWWVQGINDSVNCACTITKPARTDNTGSTLWRTVTSWTAAQVAVATWAHRVNPAIVIPAGFVVGDIIDCGIELKYYNATNAGGIEVSFEIRDSGNVTLDSATFLYSQASTIAEPSIDGIIWINGLVMPSNFNNITVKVVCRNLASTIGGYTLDIGNISMRKRISI